MQADSVDPVAELREVAFGLDAAEADGTLQMLGSTYSVDNHAVYDGLSRSGPRIVSFAPILKHGVFPLPAVLDQLMRIGEDAMGRPVEIEFAVRLPRKPNEAADFSFLQLRPLVLSRGGEDIRLEDVEADRLVCQSSQVLGHGRLQDLRDVIVVDFHRFERARSAEVAQSVAHFNAELSEDEYSVPADWSWPLGVDRSMARNSRGLGPDFRSAGHCGVGISRLAGDSVTGQPFLSEPHRVPDRLLHRQSRCR